MFESNSNSIIYHYKIYAAKVAICHLTFYTIYEYCTLLFIISITLIHTLRVCGLNIIDQNQMTNSEPRIHAVDVM